MEDLKYYNVPNVEDNKGVVGLPDQRSDKQTHVFFLDKKPYNIHSYHAYGKYYFYDDRFGKPDKLCIVTKSLTEGVQRMKNLFSNVLFVRKNECRV